MAHEAPFGSFDLTELVIIGIYGEELLRYVEIPHEGIVGYHTPGIEIPEIEPPSFFAAVPYRSGAV